MTAWFAVLTAGGIGFAIKLAGYSVPPMLLEQPRIIRVSELLPAALLASLVMLQTFTSGTQLVLDARAAGLAIAAAALLARAPFIVVVAAAAVTAALLRLAGWT